MKIDKDDEKELNGSFLGCEGIIEEEPKDIDATDAVKLEDAVDNITMDTFSDPENVASTTENLEKFKDAQALLRAYKCLESEFTKKCQQIKQQKQALSSLQVAKDELEKKIESSVGQDEFIEKALENESVYNSCIEKFLNSKAQEKMAAAPLLRSSIGKTVLTQIAKPKTLEEAARLARQML